MIFPAQLTSYFLPLFFQETVHYLQHWKLQFEEALNSPDPKEGLRTLIDPKLGEDYPIDSILKVKTMQKKMPLHIRFSRVVDEILEG